MNESTKALLGIATTALALIDPNEFQGMDRVQIVQMKLATTALMARALPSKEKP